MYYPAFFDDDMFDAFDHAFDPEKTLYGRHAKNMMKTDVRETEDAYILDVELPGFRKDEITVKLEKGQLTIAAEKAVEADDEAGHTGKVIRRERYDGKLERSFYVGDEVRPEEISAAYENGVLQLTVPKKNTPKEPERRTIEIQ